MTALTVRRADGDLREVVLEAFAAGCVDEVVNAWVLEGYPIERFLSAYTPAIIDQALRDDEVWVAGAGDEIWAVSLWQHITSAARFEAEAVEAAQRAAAAPELRPLRRASTVMALLAREHPREFPHRYLQVIVTVPEHRGNGAGAAILADRLKAASDEGIPAFLEASTERSARLYTRMGFVSDGTAHTLPEDGPTLLPLWYRG
ncbi:GNAT family N-acetyltransferase [Nocardia sp. NBC_00565]|uniref:GNAT family N-acetyltransferase n=1 Tax=Nocardia sp. NBC_00565 TaxID=2975993 RepID=UPI002E8090C9|nr:GNAT family N-acetyltransferase [Nocardia sp. NBC_00565]WUC04322.1 GNAT family N-acetyltransferase [Nocardia sp. NBC_00565]